MPFRYACFVSYRHGQGDVETVRDTVLRFRQSLAGELAFWLDLPVYLDESRLQPGHLYNEALATALCQSVCMVMLFTPTYFDSAHRYCAREYHGMLALEQQRLAHLDAEQRQYGLIIPIILRGERFLPVEIASRRKYRNFEGFLLGDRDPGKRRDYREAIKELAEYITDRHETMRAVGEDVCKDCETFSLPPGEDLDDWIERILSPAGPFADRRKKGA
jgi:hypothetical protein